MNPNEPTTGELEQLNSYLAREFVKGPSINLAAVTQATIDEIRAHNTDSAGRWGGLVKRSIAGRVFSALASRGDGSRGGYSAGSLPRWVGYTIATISAGIFLALAAPSIWNYAVSSDEVTIRNYVTRRAQRTKVQLPDGSQVVMAPDTRISYKSSSNGEHTVFLQGQAYFTVMHASERPFMVRTGTISTKVLGTAFAVRAYPTDPTVQVAVAEGKVSTGGEKTSTVVLLAGDVARVNPSHAPVVIHDSKTGDVFGWMRGQLAFDGVPFHDVAVELERLYDVEVQFSDSTLASHPIMASFAGEPLPKVLALLSGIADASYTQRGRVVVFSTRQ